MSDFPDWLTGVQGVAWEAFGFRSGADASKPVNPDPNEIWYASDTKILYICVTPGVWTGFDASILVQGALTLYADVAGGGFEIKNIKDPTAAQSAATRAYALAQIAVHAALTATHGIAGTIAGLADIATHAALATGVHNVGASTVAKLTDRMASKAGDATLGWTDEKLLKGAGVGVAPDEIDVPSAHTKEFFAQATFADGGGTLAQFDHHPGVTLDAANESAYIGFHVPWDFTSIVEAVIIVCPTATQAAADWNIGSYYGPVGQNINYISETDNTTTYNVTTQILKEVNIAGILTSIAAGHYVGIKVTQGTAGHNLFVLGVRFKYT